MILFLDTSVLVKLYHNEDGSDRIEKIIKDGVSAIALSELSILEFRSALLKKCRTGELDVSAAKGSKANRLIQALAGQPLKVC